MRAPIGRLFSRLLILVAAFSANASTAHAENIGELLGDPLSQKPIHQNADQLFERTARGETVPVIVRYRLATKMEEPQILVGKDATWRAFSEIAQERLLAGLPANSASQVKKFQTIPYLAVTVNEDGLRTLMQDPSVLSVTGDQVFFPSLTSSVPATDADLAWQAGYTGSGWTLAILDTGVEKGHDFLAGKVVSEACYSSRNGSGISSFCPNGQSTDVGAGAATPCPLAGCFHGTHVAGIAAGNGDYFSGVAKESDLIAIQVFSRIDSVNYCDASPPCAGSFLSDIIRGMERVLELRAQHDIAAVNLSLGGAKFINFCDDELAPMKAAVDSLRAAGIATVVAAGNDGFTNGINSPACISSAISVGNTTDGDAVHSTSNSASILTLLAPGTDVTSSLPGNMLGAKSGTSMSAPHVAGCLALVREAHPEAGTDEVLAAMLATGTPVTDPRNGLVTPRIDCDDTIRWLDFPRYALMVRPHGQGSVTSEPAGIDCWGDCMREYWGETEVALTATPAPGWRFSGWSPAACGQGDRCVVSVDDVRVVDAHFEIIDDAYEENDSYLRAYDLSNHRGEWLESIRGPGVQADFDWYRIQARPGHRRIQVEMEFVHADGDLDLVMIDEDGYILASSDSVSNQEYIDFTVPWGDKYYYLLVYLSNQGNRYDLRWNDLSSGERFPLVVTLAGNGSGNVASSPGAVNCGTVCTDAFLPGEQVSLTATPAAGSTFAGWSGACSGTGGCTVAMDTGMEVTATFTRERYPLLVTFTGDGAGSIREDRSSFACGNYCSEQFDAGATITLIAEPDSSSIFAGWQGACSGTGSCTLDMNQPQTVGANFLLKRHSVTVEKEGAGEVNSAPPGITCGSDCSEVYGHGTVVRLTALPAAGSFFAGWGGPCAGTGDCVFTLVDGARVAARFAADGMALSVTKAGVGSGTVTSSLPGIDCGVDCNSIYPKDTRVTLSAKPDQGSRFVGWSGGGCSGNGDCELTLGQPAYPMAVFGLDEAPVKAGSTLAIIKAGTGSGTVTSSLPGIDCGMDCSENYAAGTSVTLAATPAAGSVFVGWSGGGCGGNGACTITLDQARSPIAVFGLLGK